MENLIYCRDVQQLMYVNKLVTRLSSIKTVVEIKSTRIPYPNTIGQRGDSGLMT